MEDQKELEQQIFAKIGNFKKILRKVGKLITVEVGGVSILGVAIIIATITYSFNILENNLFIKLNHDPVSKRVRQLDLRSSNIMSLTSQSSGETLSSLVDGDMGTNVEPNGTNLDYIIDLGGLYEVHEVFAYWGAYGRDPDYINSWVLEGKEGSSFDEEWVEVGKGGFPASNKSVVKVDNKKFTQLRVTASGGKYIGIYELGVIGKLIKR